VKNFAFERGRSNVILHGRDPVSPENRHSLNEKRAASDRYINDLLKPSSRTIPARQAMPCDRLGPP